jgi:hypothetical protein
VLSKKGARIKKEFRRQESVARIKTPQRRKERRVEIQMPKMN